MKKILDLMLFSLIVVQVFVHFLDEFCFLTQTKPCTSANISDCGEK